MLVSFSSCVFGLVVDPLNCSTTKLEIRKSRKPVVFSIDLPVEVVLRKQNTVKLNSTLLTYDEAVMDIRII
ncbi:hypothetical protein L596_018981 [Steinernema carpocapsae]|uniref:Uncharacterized protein n=1 Tax=Steinernema carpocapsae TaxID=34508 RepID=A0A4U5N6Z2_STECR|nr:hypothetical protein L596_018981 [Steinernema carpocapsae]